MNALEPLFVSPWPWVIIGAILVGLEIIAPGVFLLWIGLGAVIVGLSVLIAPELPMAWQLLVFAVAMLGSIGIGFAIQRRSRISLTATTLNRELDALVGRQAEAIDGFSGGRGRIRVGDTSYTAESEAPVGAGMRLRITGRTPEGGFLVSPLQDGDQGH
ncbi:NfeD family protein [Azoarcus taiwanensis]|uniref:NfeD family protein n=1 Tax=Azoarcus taiwanensis TaxID=666964 RepID=A0A972F6T6_9RHOO|nr:NfeD family protein [Azoarcus taiwanensis]NMG02548.1 NfeD family protein [Azoarcus taiwanensis]